MNTIYRNNNIFTFSILTITIPVIMPILTIIIGIHTNISSITSEDDIYFVYYSAAKIVDTERHDQMTHKISTFLSTDVDAPHDSFRFDERNRVVDKMAEEIYALCEAANKTRGES